MKGNSCLNVFDICRVFPSFYLDKLAAQRSRQMLVNNVHELFIYYTICHTNIHLLAYVTNALVSNGFLQSFISNILKKKPPPETTPSPES